MISYVLILFMSIGPLSEKDSMALTSIPGFYKQEDCINAGKAAVLAFDKGTKDGKFVCVAQTGKP